MYMHWTEWLPLIGGVTAALIGIIILSVGLSNIWCGEVGDKLNRYTEYDFWVGCMIEVNNEMVPYKRWVVQDEN